MLKIIDPVLGKYIENNELKIEIAGMMYSYFNETISSELKKTFVDSRMISSRNELMLRKKWAILKSFYEGIKCINDSILSHKLQRILLDTKGREYLQTAGVSDVPSFKVRIISK